MGSRDEPSSMYQPLLSSLVVRASDAGGGGGGGGSDYEPGEVRHDAPQYPLADRYAHEHGYRARAVSGSPVRRRDADRRFSPDYDQLGGPHRRGFGSGRGGVRSPGRNRDYSPPYPRGSAGGRPFGRAFDGPGVGPGPIRGDGHRHKPNVRPREGDWYCPECGNLNFARRDRCNNCSRDRYAPILGLRRGYGARPPPGPPRRFPGPPVHRSPGRPGNGYRSPPLRGWLRDGPKDFGPGGPPQPPRHEGRFLDHHARRDRVDFPGDDYRDQGKFERLPPPEWTSRDRARDPFLDDRKGYERRPSPLPPPAALPQRGRWPEPDIRERSRSPVRGGLPPKEFQYQEQDRDGSRGGRDRIGSVY